MVNWFAQERQTGLTISRSAVKAQAEIYNKSIHGDEIQFVASQGWLWWWQKCHGITKHKIVGEKRSADKVGAAQFLPRLLQFLDANELVDKQIYKADKSGYFTKSSQTLRSHRKIIPGRAKDASWRRTASLFCSASIRPARISWNRFASSSMHRKYAKPRYFSHVNMKTLSLAYTHSGNRWMTATISHDWFDRTLVLALRTYLRQRPLDKKAVLQLDNCR